NDIECVINAAGYTGKPNVDACEYHKGECIDGNVTFPWKLAEFCKDYKVPLCHVSSGCIYTGSGNFTEKHPPNFSFRQNFCSFYSGSKALGEEVLKGYDNVWIWRLRIPFDNRNSPRNYLTKLMTYPKLLEAENSISHLEDFVTYCLASYRLGDPGIYNITNTGSVTTSQVVDLIKKYNIVDKEFQFFKDEIEFMQQAAKAPRSNCTMDNSKLRNLGIPVRTAVEAIEDSLKNWNKELY
ncbi:MAG: NAD-dependent epimerase/dehydratase family protein, partial [Proteobacteria bacterium]|nr:NAD-dependent epimerase/dehydratase family protein [Pseudomonadota bacterium]